MSSHLRLQSSFEPFRAPATVHAASPLPRAKKPNMSLTQTYYVASTARSKLGREAGRADHDLRLLVGHANLLDSLMVELADAEREQHAWFHRSVAKPSQHGEPRHIPWVDTTAEIGREHDDDDDDPDPDHGSDYGSDDGEDIYDEDADLFNIPLMKIRSPPVQISSEELDEDMESDDDFDHEALALTRLPSVPHSPPALTLDSDSDSEDDAPSMLEQLLRELRDQERPPSTPSSLADRKASRDDSLLAPRNPPPMIAAC